MNSGNTENKVCGKCLIYAKDMYGEGHNGCAIREYEGDVPPHKEACGRYINRQVFLSHVSRKEGTNHYRPAPEDNSSKEPVRRYWAKDHDPITGAVTGFLPYCPSCNSLTFGENSCDYCGQPFTMDQQSVCFFTPQAVETRDCPSCKAKASYRYVRHGNGKKENGYCTNCGFTVMDFPQGVDTMEEMSEYLVPDSKTEEP